jgi:hypothetical protein
VTSLPATRPHLLKIPPPSNSTTGLRSKPLTLGHQGTFHIQTTADAKGKCTPSEERSLAPQRAVTTVAYSGTLPKRHDCLCQIISNCPYRGQLAGAPVKYHQYQLLRKDLTTLKLQMMVAHPSINPNCSDLTWS